MSALLTTNWDFIHAAVCFGLAFAMFCRVRLTTDQTAKHVRWAISAVLSVSIAAGIASFSWPKHWVQFQTALILSVVYMQWAMSRQWANDVAPKGLQ